MANTLLLKKFNCCRGQSKTLDATVAQTEIAGVYDSISKIYDLWGGLTESRARIRALELAEIKNGLDILEVAVGTGLAFFEIVKRNHELAFKDAELVIRHLVLPNHFKCCTKPIFEFIAKNFKEKAVVNVMQQYHPEFKADQYPDINRRLTAEEYEKAVKLAQDLNLNYIT